MSCGTQGIRLVPVDTSRLAARSFIAFCSEIPDANGQGKTKEEAIEGLPQAVALIFHDSREECNLRHQAYALYSSNHKVMWR
jgi:predicted RNase H-like HicB family nuclease